MESLDDIFLELTEINDMLGRLRPEGTTLTFTEAGPRKDLTIETVKSDDRWRDKIQKWFDKVKDFAERNELKGFTIQATVGLSPNISITLDFECKE